MPGDNIKMTVKLIAPDRHGRRGCASRSAKVAAPSAPASSPRSSSNQCDERGWRPGGRCASQSLPQGHSSIGRASVSKTEGWGFDSLCPCQPAGPANLRRDSNGRQNQVRAGAGWSLRRRRSRGLLPAVRAGLILRVLSVLAGSWCRWRAWPGLPSRVSASSLSPGVLDRNQEGRLAERKETVQTTGDRVRLRGRHGDLPLADRQEPGVGFLRPDPGLEEIMTKRWYVVHAYSGFEKSVQRALAERINAGMEETVRPDPGAGRGSGRDEERPEEHHRAQVLPRLRAGRDGDDDDTWHLVKNTAKVTGFVGGTANKPTPISEKEVEKIMQQMQEGVEKPRPRCCSRSARRCASRKVRSPTSTATSRTSTTRRASCACR
jgi:hypothetical protein